MPRGFCDGPVGRVQLLLLPLRDTAMVRRLVAMILLSLAMLSAPMLAWAMHEDVAGNPGAFLEGLASTGRQGDKGRLVLGDFSVALYESDEKTGPNAAVIVDAEDSAAWFMWFGSESPIIADHCTQGFDVIKSCEVGDVCYIVNGEHYTRYVCVAVDPFGINDRHDMYLSSGYNILRGNEPGYLYMYTCNKAGEPRLITVVVWKPA